jgi:Protein kinase domain
VLLSSSNSASVTKPSMSEATLPESGLRELLGLTGRESPICVEIAEIGPNKPERQTMRAPGTILADRYRVLRTIANGGMGVVYACSDVVLQREVAVKVILDSMAAQQGMNQRFFREARVTAQLRGPHIAQVYDCGMLHEGEPYMAMELLDGGNLLDLLLKDGPLPADRVVGYAMQVCEGLSEAHAKGIIHRDLKPENLALTYAPDGAEVVKLLDFGISKQLSWGRLTVPGVSIGSPSYTSPEQLQAPSDVDGRADIWSLGVVLFELLTGEVPFDGSSMVEVCASVLRDAVPRLTKLRSDIPVELEAIVLRCLEKDREQRFANVSELLLALRSLSLPSPAEDVAEVISHTSPASPASGARAGRSVRRGLRRPWTVACACAAVCATVLLVASPHEVYRVGHSQFTAAAQSRFAGRAERFLEAKVLGPIRDFNVSGLVEDFSAARRPRPRSQITVPAPASGAVANGAASLPASLAPVHDAHVGAEGTTALSTLNGAN